MPEPPNRSSHAAPLTSITFGMEVMSSVLRCQLHTTLHRDRTSRSGRAERALQMKLSSLPHLFLLPSHHGISLHIFSEADRVSCVFYFCIAQWRRVRRCRQVLDRPLAVHSSREVTHTAHTPTCDPTTSVGFDLSVRVPAYPSTFSQASWAFFLFRTSISKCAVPTRI